jgi:hypothetical protein
MRNTSFCTKGYAEIHIQRPFLVNKIGIGEILGMKIQKVLHMLWCPFYTWKFLFIKNTKISIFGGILMFLELIVFGQILAILGNFRQICTDFVALVVVDSMPKDNLKS